MYIILRWNTTDKKVEHLTVVGHSDGSIMIFDTLKKADDYANAHPDSDNLRVISIDAVKE